MKTRRHSEIGRRTSVRQRLGSLAGLVSLLAWALAPGSAFGAATPKSTIVRTTPGGFSPVPIVTSVTRTPTNVQLEWFGITPPYQVQSRSNLTSGSWLDFGRGISSNKGVFPLLSPAAYFRVEGTAPNYVGAETCSACHSETHRNWMVTRHANAFETLRRIRQHTNSYCLQCHVVGLGLPNGFQNEAATPHLKGVQCENCHGPGGNHANAPTVEYFRPKVEMSAKVCGGCHSDAHHPTYDEWELAKHSHAVDTIKNLPFGDSSCLQCHSQDYRYGVENGLTPPTKQTAQLSIECSTCHTAHGPSNEVAQLRKPIGMLCGECHTSGEATLGDSPHHPQYPVLSGFGTYRENGSGLTNATSTHSSLAEVGGQACAQCHVVMNTVPNPNEGNPNVTGHTFNPFDSTIDYIAAVQYKGCLTAGCHTTSNSVYFLRFSLQRGMSNRLAGLAPYFNPSDPSYIDPATLSPADQQRLSAAKFNYQFLDADKSRGIHNPNFYRESLTVSETIVNSLKQTAGVAARAGP